MQENFHRLTYIFYLLQDTTDYIPADKQKKHRNGIVTFSKTGEFLWEQLSRRQTERSLVHLLAAECGKDEKEIKADVDEFIEKAVEEKPFP